MKISHAKCSSLRRASMSVGGGISYPIPRRSISSTDTLSQSTGPSSKVQESSDESQTASIDRAPHTNNDNVNAQSSLNNDYSDLGPWSTLQFNMEVII